MRWILVAQAVVLGAAGAALFAMPTEAARYWPWTLTPLAARFIGSSLIAIAVGSVVVLRWPTSEAIVVAGVMDIGLLLAPASGLLGPAPGLSSTRMLALLVVVALIAAGGVVLLVTAAAMRRGGQAEESTGSTIPRGLVAFFAIHLVLVSLVGGAMFLLPAEVKDRWPWQLSVVNVRLVGSIFLGSVPLSILALRNRHWAGVVPTLATYGTFTALALVAVAVHFALFNRARITTWVFLALYVAVTAIAAIALADAAMRARSTSDVDPERGGELTAR